MSSYPPYKLLELPKYSPTMETGNVNAWLKKEGDFVEANESIAEIETDKASVDFEVSDECYLAKVRTPLKRRSFLLHSSTGSLIHPSRTPYAYRPQLPHCDTRPQLFETEACFLDLPMCHLQTDSRTRRHQ